MREESRESEPGGTEPGGGSGPAQAPDSPRPGNTGALITPPDQRHSETDGDRHGFTLTVDWLSFTLPESSVADVTKTLGGDWCEGERGIRGYPVSWICLAGNGTGLLGTGAPRRPKEVHVSLSGGIVSTWTPEALQSVLRWIEGNKGKATRLDLALDDRQSLRLPAQVYQAIEAGQAVTCAEKWKLIHGGIFEKNGMTGDTLEIGSRHSQTFLRVYDKRSQMKATEHEDWESFGVRWELELKEERASVASGMLRALPQEEWLEAVVGVLVAHLDFRDTSWDEVRMDRCRAARLPWWEELTQGFKRGRLVIAKPERTIEHVKRWADKSLAPMLAVLRKKTSQAYFDQLFSSGAQRWKNRHHRLLGPSS